MLLVSQGEHPLTFKGLGKKDWLHRAYLSDNEKQKIECLSNALFDDPEDGHVWHTIGDKYADFDSEKADYCWNQAATAYLKRLDKFKDDAKKYRKDSSHLLFMDVTTSDVIQLIASMYFSLGSTYMNLKKWSFAIEAYNQSYSINDNPDCLYFTAEACLNLKDYDRSEELLRKNIEITWEYRAYYLLGIVLWRKNQFHEAQHCFWSCIDVAFDDADSNYYKHLAYRALGNSKKTEFYLKKAFECEPNTARVFDLISFYEEARDSKKCKKYYAIAHELHKKSQIKEVQK